MSDWLEADLHVNARRLHYYRTGGEKPPMVFVHGFTDNALYWTRTAQALAAAWDIVMYDARGHGKSDRAQGRFGEAERVGDLVGLIEALRLDQPVLIGHSMGAATIAQAAAQYPGLARGIILEDPAWFEPAPDETPDQAPQRQAQRRASIADWRAWVQAIQSGTVDFGLAQIHAHSPHWSDLDKGLSLAARRQVELALFDAYPLERSPWRSVVSQIQCPILLLLGDDQSRNAIVTVEQAEQAARLWRRGRWAQIRGAGHSIRYDQFERFIEVVQAFLQEMP